MKTTVWRILAVLVVLGVVGVAAGPWAYKTYVEGPPEPALALPPGAQPAETDVDGSWTVQPGSQAGYRVQQQLLWELVDVTGRTSAVTGEVEINKSRLRAMRFTVDVATMESGKPNRDEKFRSSDALETASFPAAELTGDEPIDLSAIADDGSPARLKVPVQVTLKGVTRPATAQLEVRRNGDRVDAAGTVPVMLPDFGVVPPTPFAGLLEVQPEATIEFLVQLAKS